MTKQPPKSAAPKGKFGDLFSRANRVRSIEDPVEDSTPTPGPSALTPTKTRQPGKKDNPDYVQVTVYLRKDTYAAARKALFDDRKQFSDLAEELVLHWLTTHSSGSETK